jgi:glycine/D-amino acid oxidase-like deaminating enzyme
MPVSLLKESDVDVLVIGAGPAGLMCANGLAQAGVNVRVIDKRYVEWSILLLVLMGFVKARQSFCWTSGRYSAAYHRSPPGLSSFFIILHGSYSDW